MEKFKVIKKLVETNGNKKAAAKRLDCTGRHINRMIVGYREFGKEFFVHGNRKHKPVLMSICFCAILGICFCAVLRIILLLSSAFNFPKCSIGISCYFYNSRVVQKPI